MCKKWDHIKFDKEFWKKKKKQPIRPFKISEEKCTISNTQYLLLETI